MKNLTNNKVLSELTKDFTHEGKEMSATIKCFEQPFAMNDWMQLHTQIEIFEGKALWGSMALPKPFNQDKLESILDDVIANADNYKL